MKKDETHLIEKQFNFKHFLKIFGIIIGISLFIYSLFILYKYNTIVQELDRSIKIEIDKKSDTIQNRLEHVKTNLHFIAEYVEIQMQNNANAKQNLENFFYLFSKKHKNTLQLRYLNTQGKEIIRVDNKDGKTVINKKLQDKSQRYYFTNSQNLKKDEIYISPLDLNIEYGKIEIPYKPVIRFVIPVFIDGEKQGYVILNYLAKKLLANIRHSNGEIHSVLLNKSSYYLIGFNRAKEFGFMMNYPKNSFKSDFPFAWESILNKENKKLKLDDKYAFFQAYTPFQEKNNTQIKTKSDAHWYLLLYYSKSSIYAQIKEGIINDFILYLPILLLLSILSYIITIFQMKDIQAQKTLLKSKEKAEKAVKSKAEFLANMSHEIRTPLNAIIGLINATLETKLNSTQKSYLTKSSNSSYHLLYIINDILDYSKMESNQMKLEKIPFELDKILHHISSLFGLEAKNKNITLNINIDPHIHNNLLGDPFRLTQVLVNLVGNALKFTKQGYINIEVILKDKIDEKSVLYFEVSDSGIGIEKEKQQLLFQKFNQVDCSDTREYGGTGLGLAISQNLIKLMNGNISVQSEKNKGSTFSFQITLPNRKEESSFLLQKLQNKNVLLFSFSEKEKTQLSKMINLLNLKLTCIEDENSLTENAINATYDYILVDWSFSKTQALQILDLDTKTQLFILCDSWEEEEIDSLLKSNGYSSYKILTKPFSTFSLLKNLVKDKKDELPAQKNQVELLQGKILIVEDNEINQLVARLSLEKYGLDLEYAENGEIAVEKVKNNSFDLILMDIQMPIMDGYQATTLIRQFNKNVPIIALSAAVMDKDIQKTKQVGMNAHLPKPFKQEDLHELLIKYLKSNCKNLPNATQKKTTIEIQDYRLNDYINEIKKINYCTNNGNFISQKEIASVVHQTKIFANEILAKELENSLKKFDYKNANEVLETIKRSLYK